MKTVRQGLRYDNQARFSKLYIDIPKNRVQMHNVVRIHFLKQKPNALIFSRMCGSLSGKRKSSHKDLGFQANTVEEIEGEKNIPKYRTFHAHEILPRSFVILKPLETYLSKPREGFPECINQETFLGAGCSESDTYKIGVRCSRSS